MWWGWLLEVGWLRPGCCVWPLLLWQQPAVQQHRLCNRQIVQLTASDHSCGLWAEA
eukprot:COSAG01_NODE_19_length_39011_cov_38.134968_40_plen_56_part_00